MDKKNIGILGGTFNPIHNGHIKMAEYALDFHNINEIWFMPNYYPPHKDMYNDNNLLDHRLNMLELVVSEDSRFKICDIEIKRGGRSYTYETLTDLTKMYPDHKFYFIIGEDSIYSFEQWVRPDIITQFSDILVAHRHTEESTDNNIFSLIEYLKTKYNCNFYLMDMPFTDVSSSEIRKRANLNIEFDDLVPEKIKEYILNNHLYTT